MIISVLAMHANSHAIVKLGHHLFETSQLLHGLSFQRSFVGFQRSENGGGILHHVSGEIVLSQMG